MNNRRTWKALPAAGAVLAAAAALTACSPQVTTQMPDVIQVQNVENQDGQISLSASETVKVTPDMARIIFAITTEHADAAQCQQENTRRLDQVLAFLKEQGFADSSIKTSDFSLTPEYDWSGNTQTLVGYSMTTEVTVSDAALDQVGGLLSQAVEAGVNEIRDVSYYSSQYDQAYEEALAAAVELARQKAEVLAEAGGRDLGEVIRIEEHTDGQQGRYVSNGVSRQTAVMEAAAADMAVMPGEMEIEASVTVVYASYLKQ